MKMRTWTLTEEKTLEEYEDALLCMMMQEPVRFVKLLLDAAYHDQKGSMASWSKDVQFIINAINKSDERKEENDRKTVVEEDCSETGSDNEKDGGNRCSSCGKERVVEESSCDSGREQGKESPSSGPTAKEEIIHNLKTIPQYFEQSFSGVKKFELRENDRFFKKGDYLILKEWDGAVYSGREIKQYVEYILHGPVYRLPANACIMSVKTIWRKDFNGEIEVV